LVNDGERTGSGALIGGAAGGVLQGAWWAPAVAFAAGVVSFASPCVLPLVPGYLLMITGDRAVRADVSTPAVAAQSSAGGVAGARVSVPVRRPILPILLFILGFALVFTLLGGFAGSAIAGALRSDAGQRVAGIVVIAFGVFMLLYAFRARIMWLYRDERPLLSRVRPGAAGALPLGMAFAVGWTPCIGPVLGAILTLAAAQGNALRASLLLFVYSLGLGVPFLLIGLGLTQLMGAMRFFSRHYRAFTAASGVLLVVLGFLLVTGLWGTLLAPLLRVVNRFTPPI
jgi:cytochrome c-type biogenesis protein